MVEFKDSSNFPVLFKTYLIFKDFSRKPSKLSTFQACANLGSGKQWILIRWGASGSVSTFSEIIMVMFSRLPKLTGES